ncbi:hypothetical protein [Jeotgalibacillus terrae]|uniref:Uncharacterized protein n=1 Tax=Jeotgalibacillus terrae TaxID=587735 RepID=A0ABW5ZJ95_9BACL|nr:hypothetical protein [Jeotgalibacillus terrae]MBM7580815.1 hypothetical protein [Jeotgalibacillus terrae]
MLSTTAYKQFYVSSSITNVTTLSALTYMTMYMNRQSIFNEITHGTDYEWLDLKAETK